MKLLKYIVFIVFLFSSPLADSKDHRLKVLDAHTKEPLIGASIYLKSLDGNNKDSVAYNRTDSKGEFICSSINNALIKISYIGYNDFIDTLSGKLPEILLLEPIPILMKEVVTTGQYTPRSIQKSVYPIKVVNTERIRTQAAVNLRDLMTAETNVNLSQDGILGTSLSINGVEGQNVKIMVDGIPVIGRLNGNIDVSQINLNNAERIEIIEGPMSSIYGSDALGGVINIITKTPENKGFEAGFNSFYETVGNYNFDGILNYHESGHLISLSAGRNFFGGFSVNDTSRNKQWDPKEQYFSELNYTYRFSESSIKYSGKYFYEYILNRGTPRPPYLETAFDDNYKTFRISNSIFYNSKIGKNHFLDLTGSYSNFLRRKNTYFKNLVTLDEKLTNDPDDHDTSGFNSWLFRASFSNDKFYSDLSYQTGIDINIENAEGKRIEGNNKDIGDYAMFVSIQYHLTPDFLIQPSIRGIYNSQYDAPLVPALNMKYEFNQNLIIRGSYARGFRSPTIKELYFSFHDSNHDINGNSDLKAENSHSINLAANIHYEGKRNAFRVEPKFFYNHITNRISLVPENPGSSVYTNKNIDKYKTIGGDIGLTYILEHFTFRTGFSYVGRYNELSEEFNTPEFKFTPEFQLNTSYSFTEAGITASLFYKLTGKQPGVTIDEVDGEEELAEYFTESYNMLDLNISKEFFDNSIKFMVGVKNLFNVTNIDRNISDTGGIHSGSSGASVPVAWGRTLFTEIRINIK